MLAYPIRNKVRIAALKCTFLTLALVKNCA